MKISTYLYTKSIERHQYLCFASSHPNHTNRSIVCSQGFRVKKINCEKEDFLKDMAEMKVMLA